MWPTWYEALAVAVLCVLATVGLRRWRPDRFGGAQAALRELALIAGLYSVWRVARVLPLARDEGAIDRARQIVTLQNDLHLPTELSLQQLVLRHEWLAWSSSAYYLTVHVPALIGFLVWLYVRHRDQYPHWRNGLAILTGFCLVIRFVRVAPPRFLPDLGYIDIADRHGLSVYGPRGTGVSDQFAAMPSIHVGWAAVVTFGIITVSTSRWRWLFLLHLVITILVVSATGNHWWLDGIVAIALLEVALGIDTLGRRLAARWRTGRPDDEVGPRSDPSSPLAAERVAESQAR